jgi:hypothetical protein
VSVCIIWRGSYDTKGYGRVKIRGKYHKAHRIAYEAAVGPIPEGLFICHRCGNPACVNPEHLYAGTQKENCADRDRHGRTPRGIDHHRAKLTPEKVLSIRARGAQGARQKQIAQEFGISATQVRNVQKRKQWGHVS